MNTHGRPACGKTNIVKNEKRNGKPSFLRKDCGRPFVENPTNNVVDSQTRATGARLPKERTSLRAIGRGCDLSMPWLLRYASTLYKNDVGCKNLDNLKKEDLGFEIDEICTFAGNKKGLGWCNVAKPAQSSPSRSETVAKRLLQKPWKKNPEKLKQNGIFYTN